MKPNVSVYGLRILPDMANITYKSSTNFSTEFFLFIVRCHFLLYTKCLLKTTSENIKYIIYSNLALKKMKYKAFFNILCTKYMDIAHFVEQVYKRESNRTQQDTK